MSAGLNTAGIELAAAAAIDAESVAPDPAVEPAPSV